MYSYSLEDLETGRAWNGITSREAREIIGVGRSTLTKIFCDGDEALYSGRYVCKREYVPIEASKGMSLEEIEEFFDEWRKMQRRFGVAT